MKHISSLDGIRGIAILAVVYFHYMDKRGTGVLGALSSAGWMGVDLFLVLSGFLITSILWEQRGREHYFRNFYTRRALRLFPLYYSILGMILVLTPVLHIQWHALQLAFFFYCSNYMLSYHYFEGFVGPFELYHTWTLALEEQFYFFWPWLVGSLALSRRRLVQICVAGIVLAPIFRVALLHFDQPPWLVTTSLPTRMDSLLIGGALALIPLPSLRMARAVGVGSLIPLAIIVWRVRSVFLLQYPMQVVGFTCVAFGCASLLTLSLYPTTWINKIANLRFFRFFGRYSYGIYLWHYLFRNAIYRLQDRYVAGGRQPLLVAIGIFTVALGVATLLAMASYRLIEAPCLRLKRRFEPR
jgi:peptidoglycan/LPS O-acetylase OafA/YrhL